MNSNWQIQVASLEKLIKDVQEKSRSELETEWKEQKAEIGKWKEDITK